MPSDRRQLNVRMDDDTAANFDAIMNAAVTKVGVSLSQAQVVSLALGALAEKWGLAVKGEEKSPGKGKRR